MQETEEYNKQLRLFTHGQSEHTVREGRAVFDNTGAVELFLNRGDAVNLICGGQNVIIHTRGRKHEHERDQIGGMECQVHGS